MARLYNWLTDPQRNPKIIGSRLNDEFDNLNPALLNTRLAKTANYTVANADKGSTIALGGSAFYTLTFSAASGYDANFQVMVLNEDSWTSGRAKKISLSGTPFFLWPGQSALIFAQNNVWYSDPAFQRAKLPTVGITVNVDPTNGSDTANDGLATGSGNAWQTTNGALFNCLAYFDWDAIAADPGIEVKLASGATDSTAVHFSPHGYVGAQGSNAIRVNLNGGTLSAGMELFYGATFRIRNGTLSRVAGDALSVSSGARCYVEDGMTFAGAGGGSDINCEFALVQLLNSFTVSGLNKRDKIINNSGGRIDVPSSITVTISANQNMSATVAGIWPGITDLQKITWSTSSTITATNKYNILGCHVLTGSASIPGTGAGSAPAGSQAL